VYMLGSATDCGRRFLLAVLTCTALVLGWNGTAASAAEPAPGAAGWLFDPNSVVGIDLRLPQESLEALEAEPEVEYEPGTFTLTVAGQTFGPLAVGIRLKGGFGSFRALPDEKSGFKIKFDKFVPEQTFSGLKKLTLNNMVQDPSMVHETLAYELFRSVGVVAPRTGYAFVRVNDEPFGLYLDVETLDLIALARWYASTGHLYEGEYGSDVRPGAPAFEVDEGSKKNTADLEALSVAANATGGDWSDGMAGFADLGQMTRMWAAERYIGHWDGYSGPPSPGNDLPNNYYLHSDAAGEFQMLPWGTDQTWVDRLEFSGEAPGIMFEKCLADTSCAAMYRTALEQVRSAAAGLGLGAHLDYLAQRLAPCQALEVDPWREFWGPEIEAGIEATRDFVADRPGELADWLGVPPGSPATEVALTTPAGDSCITPPPPPSTPPLIPVAPDQTMANPEERAAAPGPTQTVLRVGAPRLVGDEIVTPLDLPGAERIVQRVSAQARHGWRRVCRERETREAAGSFSAGCRLSSTARRQLRHDPLTLKVRVDFMPFDGKPEFALHRLALPKG
jgi:CotH kinase protein